MLPIRSIFTNPLFVVRAIALAVAFIFIYFLSRPMLLLATFVLGQGHFIVAYLYQAEGGRLPPRKIVLLLSALPVLVWFLFSIPLVWAQLAVTVGFLSHAALDESRLLTGKYSLYTTLEGLPFFLSYSAFLADNLFHTHLFIMALLASIPILLAYAWLCMRHKRMPDAGSYGFLAWFLLTIVAYNIPGYGVPIGLLGIPIMHFVIWYGVYWYRLEATPALLNAYVVRVLAVNAVLIVLAYLWLSAGMNFLWILFTPLMYYVWTFLHGFSGMRPARAWGLISLA